MLQLILSLATQVLPENIPMFNHGGITNTTFLENSNLIFLMRVLIIIQAIATHNKYERTSLICKKLGVDTNSAFST